MAAKRFKSKVDRWIFLVLVAIIVINVGVVGKMLRESVDPLVATATILGSLLVIALIVSIMIGTHYTVDRNVLKIVSGPIRVKVPIDLIESVTATKNPLSSPAMSLDRLLIRYGKKRRIMVSPVDQAGFLKAIGHQLSE